MSHSRFAPFAIPPAALRGTHAGALWHGIVSKQPIHPFGCFGMTGQTWIQGYQAVLYEYVGFKPKL